MDTGKNKMVGMRKKRALRGTLFAVILSASMSFSALAAMTADGPGMGTAAGASADTSDSTDSEQVLKTEAAPEEGPIRMDVVYGYDNVAKSGRFLPLDIQLDNTSEETFEGTLCVTSQEPDYDGYSNNSQEKYDTYRYEFPVMIQGDSSLEKKLNISLCSKSDLMYITLMDGAGNEVLSKRLKMDLNTDAAQLFIGVLCDEPERLSYLEQVGVNYSMLRTKTIDLSVYDLPDTELGLDQLDVLLITDFNSETLTEEQTEAIWEWVHRGGILLFGTGARGDETLSAFSKQLLEYPVSPGMVYEIQMGQDRTAREPGENILSLEGTEVDLKGGTDLLTSGSLTVLSATSVGNGMAAAAIFDFTDLEAPKVKDVKCPVCGVGMYGNKSIKHKADGSKYKDFYYYGCKHRAMTRGHKCDFKKQINEELLDSAVAEVIVKLVSNPKFAAMMQEKISMKVDTSAIEQEIANYEKQLRQSYSVKVRLMEEIDSLDPDDKHYIKRKADLDDRLYKMYDKIEDTENQLVAARAKKMAIEAEKLTGDNIYKVLIFFDKLYSVMDDQEKRQLMESLLSEVQIYEERQPNGQWLKSIKFKLPIIAEDMSSSLDNDTHMETVVLLSKVKQ